MASRSWEKAHSPYWSLHVEAWRQSRMDRVIYCRQHGLSVKTFGRWMNHLISKEEARKHAEYLLELRREERRQQRGKKGKRHQKRHYAVSTDIRSRAIQAFWAMHVEAMNWSGMGVREYAASFQLSPTSLRKWRDRIENAEVEIDWRAHLHPSARPVVGTSARQLTAESSLTAASNDVPQAPAMPARRFFSDEQKLAIAIESGQPGATVSGVARKHGIVTGLLFRWRVQFGVAQKKRAKLAPVALADDIAAVPILRDLVQPPEGMMAIDLPDGRRVFAPAGSDPNVVRARVESGEIAPC
jgi:transposase-like protein